MYDNILVLLFVLMEFHLFLQLSSSPKQNRISSLPNMPLLMLLINNNNPYRGLLYGANTKQSTNL